jgi:outer membrane protein TolC
VLVRRPDVRQAEQALLAARANVDAARAAFFPKITLTGSAGVVSGDLAKLFSGGIAAWSFAPQALFQILDAGRNQANFDAAQAQRDIAVAQYERTLQAAFREVADALVARSTLAEQLRAQTALTQAEADRADLTEQRLRMGAASALESLDAQRSVFAAQQALVQVQSAYAQSTIAVYRALGGGWSAPP